MRKENRRMIPKLDAAFAACAKSPPDGACFSKDIAGDGRSEKIVRQRMMSWLDLGSV
jgi:hypothetical protein